MNKKRIIFRIAITVFMVFSLLLSTSQTLAYWVNPQPATTTTTGTVLTGEWQQAFPYDPNYSYQVGDVVTNNGLTYEAKKSGLLREPGVDNGWNRDWTQL